MVKTLSNDNSKLYTGDSKDMICFAKFLVKELDIKLYNNMLYFKNGIKYSNNVTKLKRAISSYLELQTRQDTEVINQMEKYAEYIELNSGEFNVALRNGTIVKDKFIDKHLGFTPFFLDVLYNPKAYDENVDNFINFICCNREDMRLVLEEVLGHILLVNKFPHKIFFFTGNGANGKSTFLEMITKWTGELSSHIDLSNFDDGTSLVSLIGKLVNIADDVDAMYIEKSKNLKTMASGNTISTRPIYSKPITLRNTATLIFTTNEPPYFKDKSNGIIRRIVIIPFENTVKQRIYNLDELLSTDNAKSYILNLALKGINRIYNNNLELSKSDTIIRTTMEYHIENDSVLGFYNECDDISNKPFTFVYEQYINYTNHNNLKSVSPNKFSRRLKELGYETIVVNINGKSTRVIKSKKN